MSSSEASRKGKGAKKGRNNMEWTRDETYALLKALQHEENEQKRRKTTGKGSMVTEADRWNGLANAVNSKMIDIDGSACQKKRGCHAKAKYDAMKTTMKRVWQKLQGRRVEMLDIRTVTDVERERLEQRLLEEGEKEEEFFGLWHETFKNDPSYNHLLKHSVRIYEAGDNETYSSDDDNEDEDKENAKPLKKKKPNSRRFSGSRAQVDSDKELEIFLEIFERIARRSDEAQLKIFEKFLKAQRDNTAMFCNMMQQCLMSIWQMPLQQMPQQQQLPVQMPNQWQPPPLPPQMWQPPPLPPQMFQLPGFTSKPLPSSSLQQNNML